MLVYVELAKLFRCWIVSGDDGVHFLVSFSVFTSLLIAAVKAIVNALTLRCTYLIIWLECVCVIVHTESRRTPNKLSSLLELKRARPMSFVLESNVHLLLLDSVIFAKMTTTTVN